MSPETPDRPPRGEKGETVFGSATANAVEAERRRLGVAGPADPDDWAEVWGRRIGRGLAILALAGLAAWFALSWWMAP